MKFISIELVSYIRMMLNGVTFFKLKPTQEIQLILGTNGSGKSSLLNELTPLPSSSNDFLKEGYSVKTISHNGSTYVLKSVFNNGQKHSFIKDGEELNLGATVSVQRELVRQEFKITQETHELSIGRDKFTSMSPSARRYWFTLLSNTNYEYAIGVFNKLKEKHRDVAGALKLAKTRLVTETAKLTSPEEQARLQQEVDSIHEFVQHLLEIRKPLDYSSNELDLLFTQTEEKISKLSKLLISKVNKSRQLTTHDSLSAIETDLQDLSSREKFIKYSLSELFKEFDKVSNEISLLEKTENQGIEELESKVSLAYAEQTGILTKKRRYKDVHGAPLMAIRALETIQEALGSIFLEIPSNPDKKFSRATIEKLTEELFSLTERKSKIINAIEILNAKKTHQEAHKHADEIECPSCNHKWFKGFSKNIYDAICVDIDNLSEEKIKLDKQIKELEVDIQKIHDYFYLYKSYKSYADTWPALNPFWLHVTESNLIFTNPSSLIQELDVFKSDLLLDKRFEELQQEINKLKQLIEISQKMGNVDINKLRTQSQEIENKIHTLNTELNEIIKKFKYLSSYKKDIQDVFDLDTELKQLYIEIEKVNKDAIETSRRTHFNNAIRIIQSSLIRKEEALNELKTQASIINDLRSNIRSMEVDEECLKIMVRELSPTDGLIAEGLFGFIKIFIAQMNSLIKKIWSYELTVCPCELSDDGKVELNYKFALKVQDNERPVPDVSMGSTGMKEIIDLAFKITAMKYLGLAETPLFLDEFGHSLDARHRTNSIEIMKHITDEEPFTQLFVVNHYNSIYGALTNAEICVLCSSNIDMPKNTIYNRHVETM